MTNKKVLFVSIYYETLKAYVPYLKILSNTYVYAVTLNTAEEYNKTKLLLKQLGVANCVEYSKNRVDNPKFVKSKYILFQYLKDVLFEIEMKYKAKILLNKIQPDIIIVAADKREFERLLIKQAKQKEIPTICLQWSLGPITNKSFIENKHQTLFENYVKTTDLSSKLVLKILSNILRKIFGLDTTVFADCYGGGDSDIFTVIGEGALLFFHSKGIDENKMRIIGNALVEEIYYNKIVDIKKRNQITEYLGIPEDSKFIIYCTMFIKNKDYSANEQVFLERQNKISQLLSTEKDIFVVVKLHPRELMTEFIGLEEIFKNVIVIQDIDVNSLLPYCELLLTRASTTVIYALSFKIPVLTHDVPPMPMGSYYKDIGGTIHAGSMEDIGKYAKLMIDKDPVTLALLEQKRKSFMLNHLNINEDLDNSIGETLPAVTNLNRIIEEF
jgi:hypothetical protein